MTYFSNQVGGPSKALQGLYFLPTLHIGIFTYTLWSSDAIA